MQYPAQSSIRGILYAVAAFTVWVCGNACTKLAAEAHLPPYEVVCFMGAVGASIIGLFSLHRGTLRALWPKKPTHQFILALFYLLGDVCNVVAFRNLPLPTFYTIVFTSPMLVALFAVLFLGERLSLLKIAAIVGAFGGAVFAIQPWNGVGIGDAIGYLSAFGNGFLWSLSVILTRKLSFTEDMMSMVFNNAFVQAVFCGLLVPFFGYVPLGTHHAFVLALAGSFQIAGVYCFYMAAKCAHASTIAPCVYTQIITGTAVSYLVFGSTPAWNVFAGAAVIALAGICMVTATK